MTAHKIRTETIKLSKKTTAVRGLDWEAFQQTLVMMRERRGITQLEIQALTGMNNSYYSDWERGETTPNALDWLARLAEVFETTTDRLLGRTSYDDVPQQMGYKTAEAGKIAELVDGMPEERRTRILKFVESEVEFIARENTRDERTAAVLRRLISLVDLVDSETSAMIGPVLREFNLGDINNETAKVDQLGFELS